MRKTISDLLKSMATGSAILAGIAALMGMVFGILYLFQIHPIVMACILLPIASLIIGSAVRLPPDYEGYR